MSFTSHIKRVLGYPRITAVTRTDAQPIPPPPEALNAIKQAQKQTRKLVEQLDETRRVARSVETELAAAALRIVQRH